MSKPLKLKIACRDLPSDFENYLIKVSKYLRKEKIYETIHSSNELENSSNVIEFNNANLLLETENENLKFEIYGTRNQSTYLVGYHIIQSSDISHKPKEVMILKANSETFLEHNNKNSKLRLTEMERESEHLALKIKTLDIPVKSDYMYFTFLVKEHKKMIAIYKSEAAQVQKGVETSWSTASIKIKPEYQRLPMCIRVFQSGFLNDKISGDANFSRESLVAGKVIKLSKSGSKSNHDKGAINILKADFRDRYLQAPSQTISSVSETQRENKTFAFENYVVGGVTVSGIFAVDFSLDNQIGKISLHTKENGNMYAAALETTSKACFGITGLKEGHLWGYNAKLNNSTSDCFLMSFDNNKKTQSTYEEIWATYSKARDRVGFGASKTLSEVLKTAQLLVSSNCGNIEKYYVLFVLMTNGDFEDYKQQWCAFNELSNFPITVLILGIGPGSFAKHQDFIATLKIERKNVLFMDYSGLLRRQPNDDLLVENINTLLKRQICDYYSSKRTTPGDIAMNLQMRKQPSLQTNHQGFSQPNSNLMAQENYPNLSDPMMNPRN